MSDENFETAPDGALPLPQMLGLPGVFVQSQPLTTEGYIAEAKRRGLDVSEAVLREFYRRGDQWRPAEWCTGPGERVAVKAATVIG